MNELPPEVTAYLAFHQDIQSIAVSAARDSLLDWVVGIAAAGGCVYITRTWAIYSVLSAFLCFHGLVAALETFRASFPT